MHKQNGCSDYDSQANLVLEAQRMVFWAAEPAQPGERIGAQILRAAYELRLHYGVVWRAWYKRSGPEIYPTIRAAWAALVERRHTEMQRAQTSPWRTTQQPHLLERRGRRQTEEALSSEQKLPGYSQHTR